MDKTQKNAVTQYAELSYKFLYELDMKLKKVDEDYFNSDFRIDNLTKLDTLYKTLKDA